MRAETATLICGLALSVACANTMPVPEEFGEERIDTVEYRIEPSDRLNIRVWKNPELSLEAPVLPDGTITVPLVGPVHAGGLTPDEMEDLVAAELVEFIATPEVSVIISQVNSKRASVVGEVNRQGPIGLASDVRVVDAISSAGGFTTFANKQKIRVIRPRGDGEVEFVFDYEAFVKGKAPGTNVLVQPGDVIVVLERWEVW